MPPRRRISVLYLPLVLLSELELQPVLATMDVHTEDLLAQTSVNHRF